MAPPGREVWGRQQLSLPQKVWGMVKKLNGVQFYVAWLVVRGRK